MLLTLPDLLGRFHPVLVHLPIGILLLACFFQWLTLKPRFASLQASIPVMVFWGMVGAILSCITGYMLSLSGDYDADLAGRHMWMGIFTAILSLVLFVLYRFSISETIARGVCLVIFVLVMITGHLGGSLTHGSEYLSEGLGSGEDNGAALQPIPNIQEAGLYTDVVQPLLKARCYSCHGPNKQKGKLRLDQPDFITKGGKDGKVVEAGKADESELIERMLLPMTDEDHMPPKEKKQLTANEISILHWWIQTGADFTKKVKDLPQTDKIAPVLSSLQAGSADIEKQPPDVPATVVSRADEEVIKRLKYAQVMIMPVAQNSNYLSASFFTAGPIADSLVRMMEPLRKQLVWLKLDHAVIDDATMKSIGKLTSLTRLHLNNTAITDKGLSELQSLSDLQSLNLVGTKVTAEGLAQLEKLKKLKNLYLYQTGVNITDWPKLQKIFPSTQIDSGRYNVPTLPSDTTEIKYN